MRDFNFYFFWIILAVYILAMFVLIPVNWIFGLIFLVVFIIQTVLSLINYFNSIWWPYHKVIDTDCIDIERVNIPSSIEGKT